MRTIEQRFHATMVLSLVAFTLYAQHAPVVPTGAMRATMAHGQLAGLIQLDSIASPGYYGVGPLEYLRGELLLLDGQAYCATAITDSTMQVDLRPAARAPFFVHQRVERWVALPLPDSVADLRALDAYLTAHFGMDAAPFAFRLTGHFDAVDVHVLDVPPGTEVRQRSDAQRHNKHYHLRHTDAEAIGFFSTRHKTVFTHHDAHIHVHAITPTRDWMGHVEELMFRAAQVRLWVAE
jgi:acetolactate decarboxylase